MSETNTAPDGIWWDHAEFENLVNSVLIALYEQVTPRARINRRIMRYDPITGDVMHREMKEGFTSLNWNELRNLQRIGPYFAPADRIALSNEIHHEVDGFPDEATCAWGRVNTRKSHELPGYMELYYLKRLPRLPKKVCLRVPCRPIAYYRMSSFYPQDRGGMDGISTYLGILPNGRPVACSDNQDFDSYETLCAFTAGLWADRKYVWNVQCVTEGGLTKATFGVYQSQIKSLFYARNAPRTKSRRLRPILHWVRSHRRRVKEGIDIDIERHLRGIDAFYMDGTEFRITRPRKTTGSKS